MPIRRLQSSLLIAVCVLVAACSLPALLLGLLLRVWADATPCDRRDRWHAIGSFAFLGLLAYSISWWLWHPLDSSTHAMLIAFRLHAWFPLVPALVSWWLVTMLLAPLVTILVGGIIHFHWPSKLAVRASLPVESSMVTATHAVEVVEQDEDDLSSFPMPLGSYPASDTPSPSFSTPGLRADFPAVTSLPLQVHGHAVAGYPLGGELEWVEGGRFVLPEEALCEHGVICGGSGSGKTSFAIRLASLGCVAKRKLIC